MKIKKEASELVLNVTTPFEMQSGHIIKKIDGDNSFEQTRSYYTLAKNWIRDIKTDHL